MIQTFSMNLSHDPVFHPISAAHRYLITLKHKFSSDLNDHIYRGGVLTKTPDKAPCPVIISQIFTYRVPLSELTVTGTLCF